MDYDIIIVGCGFAGATIAYLAAKEDKKVLDDLTPKVDSIVDD